jgi:hypothetical protein
MGQEIVKSCINCRYIGLNFGMDRTDIGRSYWCNAPQVTPLARKLYGDEIGGNRIVGGASIDSVHVRLNDKLCSLDANWWEAKE